MLGSEEVVPVAICDIAVPLRPHSSAIDEMMARGSDAFIAIHPDFRNSKRYPEMYDSMFSIKRTWSRWVALFFGELRNANPAVGNKRSRKLMKQLGTPG
jgi:hypothetical protein